jgi:NADH-quinone oxidoreductase subunit I
VPPTAGVDDTQVIPTGGVTDAAAAAEPPDAAQAADVAAAQGDSTQVLPTVSTDEERDE